MKKGFFLLMLCLSLGFVSQLSGQDKETLVKTGDVVPEFEVQLFDGPKVKIRELKGKVVLINFWATWCPPCQQELKRVQKEIIERFKGKDFVFLAISREETYDQIKAFREKTGYSFSMGLDTNRKIYSKFANASIPRNFIVGKDGKIAYAGMGYDEKSFAGMIQKLEELLK